MNPQPLKPGRSRPNGGRPQRVPSVESQPCPATLGSETHELVNTPAARTRCRWCARTWADLDADLRAAIGWKGAA